MATIREYPCIYDKALREYKDQRILTRIHGNKSLEAAHGINLKNVNPFVYWVEMANKTGLPRSAYGTSEASLRHTWSLSAVLPGKQLTCYRRRDCGICELGFMVSTCEALRSRFSMSAAFQS